MRNLLKLIAIQLGHMGEFNSNFCANYAPSKNITKEKFCLNAHQENAWLSQ
jgi:hypothetical protein